MIEMNCLRIRLRNVFRPAVTLAASILLLCTFPAVAGLSGAIGASGASHSLKETLEENTGIFGEMVSAFIEGDDETVSELVGEVAKTPGKLIKRAFPVLEAPQAVAEKLKSAKQRVARFVGGVEETLTDARAALAIDGDDKSGGWSDAALLEGGPLQAPAGTLFATPNYESPTEVLAALKGEVEPGTTGGKSADPSWDFEKWVIAKQEANPHCYGVVDPETLPPECFGQVDAESPAPSPTADLIEDLPRVEAADWAAREWAAEDDGWAGWDKTDDRYSDADRDAARVGIFAAECWGVYGVSRHGPMYDLMRARMQRNECPNEDTNQASSGDATAPGDDGYLSALSELEAKEEQERLLAEEQRRLEAEERERQARMEEERRQEEERLAAQRRQEQQEYDRQAAQQLGQALGDLIRAYSGDGTTGGSGTAGGKMTTCGGESKYTNVKCKVCWNGAVMWQTTPCPPKPCQARGTCGQR